MVCIISINRDAADTGGTAIQHAESSEERVYANGSGSIKIIIDEGRLLKRAMWAET